VKSVYYTTDLQKETNVRILPCESCVYRCINAILEDEGPLEEFW
jgi:hypothetical protein